MIYINKRFNLGNVVFMDHYTFKFQGDIIYHTQTYTSFIMNIIPGIIINKKIITSI